MNEPTLKQAAHFLKQIDDLKIPLKQLQAANESGLLKTFLSANFAKIDKAEFRRVCGFIDIPKIGEIFELIIKEKNGKVRTGKFNLVRIGSQENLDKVIDVLREDCWLSIPERECLEAFKKKYLGADGNGPVSLAQHLFGFPGLDGKLGERWRDFKYCSDLSISDRHRWLVEAIC